MCKVPQVDLEKIGPEKIQVTEKISPEKFSLDFPEISLSFPKLSTVNFSALPFSKFLCLPYTSRSPREISLPFHKITSPEKFVINSLIYICSVVIGSGSVKEAF